MKHISLLIIVFLISSCKSTKLTESWRNPEYKTFNPKNVLVIGVTPDMAARKAFELQIKDALYTRNINALQSTIVFEKSFQDSEQTEEEIEEQVNQLITSGYDTILVSAVKGIDENESYSGKSSKVDYGLRKFIGYYLTYQDAYFNQDYYKTYQVFHIETSIYNLKEGAKKSLVWSGTYDIVDPNDVSETTAGYVTAVIRSLEKEKLIPKLKKL